MNDQEVINLLFNAGFSTAEKVTGVSGRGVGLDVVKSKIEDISGTVSPDRSGQGLYILYRTLALTLAIIHALMVRLGDEKFAIPLNNIGEIISIGLSEINMVQNQGSNSQHRNKTLPIVRLANALNVPNAGNTEEEDLVVVIVKKGDQEAGVVVDSLIGQLEIVIKSLGKYLTGIKVITELRQFWAMALSH